MTLYVYGYSNVIMSNYMCIIVNRCHVLRRRQVSPILILRILFIPTSYIIHTRSIVLCQICKAYSPHQTYTVYLHKDLDIWRDMVLLQMLSILPSDMRNTFVYLLPQNSMSSTSVFSTIVESVTIFCK